MKDYHEDAVMSHRCSCLMTFIWAAAAVAADKDAAKINVAVPLGVPAGAATKVTLRGLRLEGVKELKCPDATGVSVKITNAGRKVGVTQKELTNFFGDTQAEFELTVPADLAAPTLKLVAVTDKGASEPYELLIDGKDAGVIPEKEPNGGFRTAQPLTLPVIVAGAINQPQDVDVFRVEGKAGQKISAEVVARRRGSPLDAALTLYDDAGRVVAHDDDAEGRDPRLEITLPRDGAYYLSVTDAHDMGGNSHVYRLTVRGLP